MLQHAHIQPKPLNNNQLTYILSLCLYSLYLSMASTLPNATYFAPQSNNVNPMNYGLTMWLGQEDCFFPFSTDFGCGLDDNFILSENITNNNNNSVSVDCSSNSSSLVDVHGFGMSGFDYYSGQSNGHSPGSTYDDFDSNGYSMLPSYVPSSTNHYVATPECWVCIYIEVNVFLLIDLI